jgi:hypothetical protein
MSSAVNVAANAKPCSSAARVCANEAWSTFERTTSLRPSAVDSLASAGIVSGKMGQSASEAAKAAAAAAALADAAAAADADDEVPTEEKEISATAAVVLSGSPSETTMGATVFPLASGRLG